MPPRNIHSIKSNPSNFPIRLSPSSYSTQRRPPQIPHSLRSFSSVLSARNKQVAATKEDDEFQSSASEVEDDTGWGDDAKKDHVDGNDDQNNTEGDAPSLENSASLIGSNPAVIKAIKQLMELQEEEDIQRFICRAVPSQRKPRQGHSNSDCCFANNANLSQRCRSNRRGCGPFLSCMVKHGKSNDYEELPDFYVEPNLLRNGFDYPPAWLQGPPPNIRGQNSVKTSAERVRKCRGCPTTSIFLADPDLWLADYKYQVTYGRIPTADKKRLKEKMEQWIPSDDYRERQAWLRQRMAALTKSQKFTLRQHPKGLVDKDALSRRPLNEHGPMYGPSAIAALSGHSGPRTTIDLHHREMLLSQGPQHSTISNYYGTLLATNLDTFYTGDDVPWPSDNLRYYDDDTDPRVTELLAQAPFLIPSKKVEPSPPATTKLQPIQASPSKMSQAAGPSVSQSSRVTKTPGKQPIIPVIVTPTLLEPEYVIGAGRVPQKRETFTTKQTPISSPSPRAGPIVPKVVNDGMKSKITVPTPSSMYKVVKNIPVQNIPSSPVSKNNTGTSLRNGSKSKKQVPNISKFIQSKKSVSDKISEPVPCSSSSMKMMPPATPKAMHVKKRISKTKTKRRFKQNISTVSLGVPKSKDSKVCYDDK